MAKLVSEEDKQRAKRKALGDLIAFFEKHPLILKEGETIKSLIEQGRR